jgi:hypothetical protein
LAVSWLRFLLWPFFCSPPPPFDVQLLDMKD